MISKFSIDGAVTHIGSLFTRACGHINSSSFTQNKHILGKTYTDHIGVKNKTIFKQNAVFYQV